MTIRVPDILSRNAPALVPALLVLSFCWQGTLPAGDPVFRRGDANSDGCVDIHDAEFILEVFPAGSFDCLDAADADDNGVVDQADAITILQFVEQDGPRPPFPYPACGSDPTEDNLDCDWYAAELCSVVCDGDGLFVRGDANADGQIDITDAVFTLMFMFLGGRRPPCMDAADANDSGGLDISDGIFVLSYLFAGAGGLPPPYPHCGPDPTDDLLVDCVYDPC
jgi:hypothetical protein